MLNGALSRLLRPGLRADARGRLRRILLSAGNALSAVAAGSDAAGGGEPSRKIFSVWNNLFDPVHLSAGESLLVHGGSSGIGLTAIQLAKAIGATVFTTVGGADKAAFCHAIGADHVINYREQDFVGEIASITGKKGVDVVLDVVGGDYIEKYMKCLALEGRMVIIAFLQGSKVTTDWRHIMMKRLTVTGSTLRASPSKRKTEIAQSLRAKVWPLFDAKKVKPVTYRVFPMADAAEAHRLMESSAHIGKIMLEVRP